MRRADGDTGVCVEGAIQHRALALGGLEQERATLGSARALEDNALVVHALANGDGDPRSGRFGRPGDRAPGALCRAIAGVVALRRDMEGALDVRSAALSVLGTGRGSGEECDGQCVSPCRHETASLPGLRHITPERAVVLPGKRGCRATAGLRAGRLAPAVGLGGGSSPS